MVLSLPLSSSSLFSLSFTPCPPGTLDSSFLLSFPSLVPPCAFALDLSLLRPLPARHFLLLYALSYLSPPALLPLSVSFLLPLCRSFPTHLSPASSSPLKVFAQSGSAQRGNTLRNHDPKWSLAAMSGAFRAGAAYDLQLSSCAFPMCRLQSWCQLYCWMPRPTIYSTTLSLGILLTLKVKLVIQPSYNCIHFATIYSSLFGFSP